MTAAHWKTGRTRASLTQVEAARTLGVSQPYLSQLEMGLRSASRGLVGKAARLYHLPPTVLPLSLPPRDEEVTPDVLQRRLASLGYPGFGHVRYHALSNPAEVVLSAVTQSDLDTRLVEALPWVLAAHPGLNWEWLQESCRARNAQNRLGYLVHLGIETASRTPEFQNAAGVLSQWEEELEESRLAREDTLCRDSMPERERAWLRAHRPAAAEHWNLLTSLTVEQLAYAGRG